MSGLCSSAVDRFADENAVAVPMLAFRSVHFVLSLVNDEVSCCSVVDQITLLFWMLRSLVIRLQSSIGWKVSSVELMVWLICSVFSVLFSSIDMEEHLFSGAHWCSVQGCYGLTCLDRQSRLYCSVVYLFTVATNVVSVVAFCQLQMCLITEQDV
ncbi:unnamed protein product [Cylicocyclus nassatus]|uniref:Uncharacterized protein n=1 Tax=Cylicocyclus nassatus TaxID=53992 RepID=A0AA36GT43_CYLNA|nr:unnamed protein product [Cylicocyclus nassatus]